MLYTTTELAKELKVKKDTIYRMFADGRIPQKYVMKIGNAYRFNKEAIIDYLFGQYVEPPTNP